jgi:hypothetical protein
MKSFKILLSVLLFLSSTVINIARADDVNNVDDLNFPKNDFPRNDFLRNDFQREEYKLLKKEFADDDFIDWSSSSFSLSFSSMSFFSDDESSSGSFSNDDDHFSSSSFSSFDEDSTGDQTIIDSSTGVNNVGDSSSADVLSSSTSSISQPTNITICQNDGIFDVNIAKCNCTLYFQGTYCQIENQVLTVVQIFNGLNVDSDNGTQVENFEHGYGDDLAYILSLEPRQILFNYFGPVRQSPVRRRLLTSSSELELSIIILDASTPSQLFNNLQFQLSDPNGWFQQHSIYGAALSNYVSSTGTSLAGGIIISSSSATPASGGSMMLTSSSSSSSVTKTTSTGVSIDEGGTSAGQRSVVIIVVVVSIIVLSTIIKIYLYRKKTINGTRVKPTDESRDILDGLRGSTRENLAKNFEDEI